MDEIFAELSRDFLGIMFTCFYMLFLPPKEWPPKHMNKLLATHPLGGTQVLWPQSSYTVLRTQCRSRFPQFQRCRRNVAVHPLPQKTVSHLFSHPPVAIAFGVFWRVKNRHKIGGWRCRTGSARGVAGKSPSNNRSHYTGVSQLHSHQSRYTVPLSSPSPGTIPQICLCLGGPNGLPRLAHQNRAVTESFRKSKSTFLWFVPEVAASRNSDHLMSFKERAFHLPFLWSVPELCRVTEIISEAPFPWGPKAH